MSTQFIDLSAGFISKHPDLSAGLVRKIFKDPETGRDVLHQSNDRDTLVKQAKDAAPQLESDLKDIAKANPGVELDGVRSTKDPDRLTEKIEKEGQPIETVPDILAGRLAVNSPEARDAAVNAIKGKFDVLREENEFDQADNPTGYRVHKLQVQVTPDLSAEIHVVPKEIADVNDKQREPYDRMRDAALEAKQINDGAMEKFEQRNDIDGSASQSQSKEVIAEKTSPEQGAAASQGAASPIKKGSPVIMPDGVRATIAYAPPESAPFAKYRAKTDDGKEVTFSPRQLKNGDVVSAQTAKDNKWIGVDLDGTLAKQSPGSHTIGAPVPEMVDRVKQALADGEDVRILTGSVAGPDGADRRKAITAWTEKHIGQRLPVTDRKDENLRQLWDNAAVPIQTNTGKIEV